ncbi:hypothetical protein VTN77DRAFT_123 [Rasamsonia byssochlamydoides]|uniref:uncharacterized protein n=1 Tax=Rasamsonia byssochlamydoides TaxID=89139 RepID=UPI0037430ED2
MPWTTWIVWTVLNYIVVTFGQFDTCSQGLSATHCFPDVTGTGSGTFCCLGQNNAFPKCEVVQARRFAPAAVSAASKGLYAVLVPVSAESRRGRLCVGVLFASLIDVLEQYAISQNSHCHCSRDHSYNHYNDIDEFKRVNLDFDCNFKLNVSAKSPSSPFKSARAVVKHHL